MKKILVAFLLIPVFFMGCGSGDSVRANMSEITNLYFTGESNGDYASISVGKREEPYIKDGISRNTCDFALICLNVGDKFENLRMNAVVEINGQKHNIILEMVGGSYMFDMERSLSAEDEVSLAYGENTINFENTSKGFGINQEEALKIAKQELKEQIDYYSRRSFEAECYLRVLGKETEQFDELFWCFTIVGKDEKTYNCIFSVKDGTVIALN